MVPEYRTDVPCAIKRCDGSSSLMPDSFGADFAAAPRPIRSLCVMAMAPTFVTVGAAEFERLHHRYLKAFTREPRRAVGTPRCAQIHENLGRARVGSGRAPATNGGSFVGSGSRSEGRTPLVCVSDG
jgi:hypothetical protein